MTESGVWFIYDGDCPLCTQAALALRIRQELGELHLLNARIEQHHEKVQAVNAQGLDLDEGMIIIHEGHFYHGKSALRFMARFGEERGWFNITNRVLFWSDHLASLLYPWMRSTRNLLLRRLNKPPIDNLQYQQHPTFAPIFGADWESLPAVMKKRYANRPYSHDRVVVEGRMSVEYRSIMHLLKPFYRLLGTVPVVKGHDIPVRVEFDSEPDSKAFRFHRFFDFPNTRPYEFRSRMLQIQDNKLVEIMRFGICWCLSYHWSNGNVLLRHRGYAWRIVGHYLPLPLHWLLGRGDAEEIPLDDNRFAMKVTMVHPWFGEIYNYQGEFTVVQTP